MTTVLNERMPYRTADTRGVREVHRVLRRFSRYLAAVTPVVRCGDPSVARATAELATEVVSIVRRLVAAERGNLWPTLLAYLHAADLPADAVHRIEADGAALDRLADAIDAAAQVFTNSATGSDRDALADLVARLYVELDAHLGRVERDALPLAEQFLTYQQGASLATELETCEPRLLPVGARSRRQRIRSQRRFACVQSLLGAER